MKQPRQRNSVAVQLWVCSFAEEAPHPPTLWRFEPWVFSPRVQKPPESQQGQRLPGSAQPCDPKDPQRSCDLRMPPVEGRVSLHLSRASLIVRGTFYPRGTGAAVGICVHKLPGLVHICRASLAVQTQEQPEPGGEAVPAWNLPASESFLMACALSEHLCYWVWSADDPRHIFQK